MKVVFIEDNREYAAKFNVDRQVADFMAYKQKKEHLHNLKLHRRRKRQEQKEREQQSAANLMPKELQLESSLPTDGIPGLLNKLIMEKQMKQSS